MFNLIGFTFKESSVSTFCEGGISQQVNLVHSCIYPGDIPNKYHVGGKLSGGMLHFVKLFRDLDRVTSMSVPRQKPSHCCQLSGSHNVCQSRQYAQGRRPSCTLSLIPGGNHECSELTEGPHFLPHDWPKGSELECVGDFQTRFSFFMDNVDCKHESHDLFVLLPYHPTLELPAPCCSGLCSEKGLWWQSLLWGVDCSLCRMD